MAESNPDTASRALAAVSRANRGDQLKFTSEQTQVIMDIVSDRLLPDMWFAQQPSGSSPTPHHRGGAGTPSPPSHNMQLADRSRLAPYTPAPPAIAPKPLHPSLHAGPHFALKPIRRGYSLDDVCADRELSMKHRTPRPRAQHVEGWEQMHKNDPRYREALLNMLPSELSSDAIEPPEDDDESAVDVDSPTRKRARHSTEFRAPRPTLPSIGMGRPPNAGHRPRSSFGRASSSDVLACSSRARYLANNPRAVTDPVPSRSASAGPNLPAVPEHQRTMTGRLPSLAAVTDLPKKRKLSRGGSWSHLPSLKHRDSFDRAPIQEPQEQEEKPEQQRTSSSSPVPGQTRSPTPTETDSVSPRSELATSVKSAPQASAAALRLAPEGRSIYSFSTELEPETKRGTAEMDENVLTGAHALMELFRGR